MSGNRLNNRSWLIFWFLVIGTALVNRPPLPVDETRYLSVAWEMWREHHFLVPLINGQPYSHKPPLLFWLMHLGWGVFGVNAWTARLTAPLFGLVAIVLSRRLAAGLWPQRPSLPDLVPWLFLGNGFWMIYSTLTLFDMLVAVWALAAWTCLWRLHREQSLVWWLGYGLALGMGLLSKGPVILVYTLPPALLAPWWRGMRRGRWSVWYGGLVFAVVLASALGLAWALPAARAGGPEYGRAILFGQTAGRVVHAFAHQRPWYWYGLLLPIFLFPWWLMPGLWPGRGSFFLNPPERFCLSILVPGILIFSLISGKQAHYLLPLLPPLVLLLARIVDGKPLPNHQRFVGVSLVFFLMAVFLATSRWIVPNGTGGWVSDNLSPWLALGPLVTALFLVVGRGGSVHRLGLAMIGILIFFHLTLAANIQEMFDLSPIARLVHQAQSQGRAVALWPQRLVEQLPFVGRLDQPLPGLSTLEDGVRWAQNHPRGRLLILVGRDKFRYFGTLGPVHRMGDQWLVFCPAGQVYPAYCRWASSLAHRVAARTGPGNYPDRAQGLPLGMKTGGCRNSSDRVWWRPLNRDYRHREGNQYHDTVAGRYPGRGPGVDRVHTRVQLRAPGPGPVSAWLAF